MAAATTRILKGAARGGGGGQGVAARFQGAVGIGTACRSAFGDTLATGDDWGVVKLFRFPCVTPGARCKRYGGHSAQVPGPALAPRTDG